MALIAAPARAIAATAARASQKRLVTVVGSLPRTEHNRLPAATPSASLTRHWLSTSSKRRRASPVDGQEVREHASQHRVPPSVSGSFVAAAGHAAGGPVVALDDAQCKVNITWNSGIVSSYHNIWLRDHCRCPKCYHQQTKQRQVDTFSIPLDLKPVNVEATPEGLLLYWPRSAIDADSSTEASATAGSRQQTANESLDTSHQSLYPWAWLYANSYSPSMSSNQSHLIKDSDIVLWSSGISQQPPTVSYHEVMSDSSDRGLARWLSKIAQFGFCFVTGVPPTPKDTETLIKRIAFIRETHYGGFWDFTSDLSHGDTAYTNLALGAHTDTTYFTDPAGLQMFHLLSHTESQKGTEKTPASGGESLLVDGFFAAKILREVYPDAYRTLSKVSISTHSAGDDETLIRPLQRSGYTILEHDEQTGELIRVRYNNDDRSVLRVRDEDVLPFYDALGKWHRTLTHSDSEYWSQLVPGTALIFDNHRVLHGRSAFTGQRRLCGAYVNHDDYRSRTSVLLKRFPELLGSMQERSAQDASARLGSKEHVTSSGSRGVWDDGL